MTDTTTRPPVVETDDGLCEYGNVWEVDDERE